MTSRRFRANPGALRVALRVALRAVILFALTTAFQASAAESVRIHSGAPLAPKVNARSVVVMDYAQGEVLYEKDADIPIPPASLTKLMTMRVIYKEIASGRLSLDDVVTILPEDCDLPYNSSTMYLQPYMHVPVRVLMLGLAVVSGNDAAWALARTVAGSIEAFAARMNEEARSLGLATMSFVEPSGLSELNLVTAREMARFSFRYLKDYPQSLADFHSVKWIEFPAPEYMPDGVPPPKGRMIQYSTNKLLRTYEGADGLKTGFIRESGYNLVATAERDGSRFIIVTLGGTGSSSRQGGDMRTRDGRELLDWAFENFKTVRPTVGDIAPVRLWKTAGRSLTPTPEAEYPFTTLASLADGVTARVERPDELVGPVARGQVVGRVVFSSGGKDLRTVRLLADADYPLGNFWVRMRDGVALFFRGLFGKRVERAV